MSDENNNDVAEQVTATRRGRPAGAKAKKVRRNFAAELAAMESSVRFAVILLRKAHGEKVDVDGMNLLIAAAIETLTGEAS